MLDGIDEYRNILDSYDIKTTFFTLGSIAYSLKSKLRKLSDEGHEIAAHGWDHNRPLKMDARSFKNDITSTKAELEQIIGKEILGYRAPCFSLNRYFRYS